MADHDHYRSETPESQSVRRSRLPSLVEVLSRTTKSPVDLFSFYIYMRDQQRSVDYLDFWLDVSQHMSLCRHYVRELRRSVLLETPEFEKAASKRSSQILENLDLRDPGPSGSITSRVSQDPALSEFLRNDDSNRHSPKSTSSKSDLSSSHKGLEKAGPSHVSSNLSDLAKESSSPEQNSSPEHTVARTDIRLSAEKVLYTFLLPGAEREIILPGGILFDITHSIEEQGRDDPEVFDAAKDYVLQAMERDAYPGFLRSKALGNLVPPSLMLRLIVGLVAMFGGFWTAFILIFLDADRATRCWILLPFTIGIYALASHQYTLDPLLALAGYSEHIFFTFLKIKETYVRSVLNKRALVVLAWIALIDLALVCLLVFVPGKRL